MVRIVILGEGGKTLSMLADALGQGGYQVRVVSNSRWKISLLRYLSPHFVIVDTENPNFSAAKVCSKIRSDRLLARVRILVLNPSNGPEENEPEEAAYTADVYLDRPFHLNSVVSCVKEFLKTEPLERTYRKISIGTLVIDPLSYQVIRRGEAVSLSYFEFKLLHHLASYPDTICSRDELLQIVWKYRNATRRIVDTTIWKLRKKIEACPEKPRFIRSAKGQGYSFHVPSD
jgi:two-component system, OmpR family, response regulator MtrA